MKLYATVQSERATKGQGGQWLDIKIQGSHKEYLARIIVREDIDNHLQMEIYRNGAMPVDTDIMPLYPIYDEPIKGERQKDEI